MINLLKVFGVEEATDKLCDLAGLQKIEWDKLGAEKQWEIEQEAHDSMVEDQKF